jgi:polyhydroxyalkanoate synthase
MATIADTKPAQKLRSVPPPPSDPDGVGTRAADALQAGEDIGGLQPRDLVTAFGKAVWSGKRVTREGAGLAAEIAKVTVGRSGVEPARGDWRFRDPAWRENPVYRRVGQGYLATARALEGIIESDELDWKTAERARLLVAILTSAAAPTNTVAGNPAALKRAFESGGKSLLRGARNLVHDVRHNGGMPSQVDTRPFRKGENLAATPGAVVYRDEVCEVLQYTPSTPEVHARPVLMIPPQINRYYFMDLAPERSFVEHAVSRGLQYFTISWRNPRAEDSDWNLDTYVEACLRAVDVVTEITRSDEIITLGLCAGGITTSTLLSTMAARGDERVRAASFGVTLLDFSVPAPIGMFLSPRLLGTARRQSQRKGVLDGAQLGRVFAWLRPNDLVFNYWVNNYLMGNDPPAFDILAWNSDGTRMAGGLHAQFLDIYEHNLIARPGTLEVLGEPVDLGKITCDNYVTGAVTDHLTPWEGCYRTTQLLGGNSTFVLSNAGHIQSLVNPPGNAKARMFVGPEPGPEAAKWRAAATEQAGTWWDHWADWSIERAGEAKRAPVKLGSRKHKAGDAAPGRYIHSA